MINEISKSLLDDKIVNIKKVLKIKDTIDDALLYVDGLIENRTVYYDKDNMLLYPLGKKYFVDNVKLSRRGNKYIRHGENKYNLVEEEFLTEDKVLYSIQNNTFKCMKIIERSDKPIISEIKFGKGKYYFSHYSEDIKFPISISNLGDYTIGDIVKIKLGTVKNGDNYVGEIVDYICNINDVDSDFKRVSATYGTNYEFSDNIVREMKNVNTKVGRSKVINRKDLRKQQFFTIDGDDAKDRDDAIAVEKLSNGEFILRVSIADVSQFVNPWKNIATYEEAVSRGTSIYSAGSVVPMLPKVLSNDACSLNERINRLTKTIEVRFDKYGDIIKYDIYNSVINSKRAFTYDEINRYLKDKVLPCSNRELLPRLDEAKELSDLISLNRIKKGAINLFSDELKMKVDSKKSIVDIKELEIGEGNRIIENFMIVANNVFANYCENNNLPIIYRVHDCSLDEVLNSTFKRIKKLKLLDTIDIGTIKDFSEYTINNEKDVNGIIASYFLLKSMMRAKYSINNEGHYGLGLDEYAQFTSPIRRLPDLVNHIILDLHLNKKEIPMDFENNLANIAYTSTVTERNADIISKEVNNIKIFDYLVKNNMTGIPMKIVDFNKNSILVKKVGLCEGIIPMDSLDHCLVYDRKKDILRMNGSNDIYKVNSVIHATPIEVNYQGIIFSANFEQHKNKATVKKKIHNKSTF